MFELAAGVLRSLWNFDLVRVNLSGLSRTMYLWYRNLGSVTEIIWYGLTARMNEGPFTEAPSRFFSCRNFRSARLLSTWLEGWVRTPEKLYSVDPYLCRGMKLWCAIQVFSWLCVLTMTSITCYPVTESLFLVIIISPFVSWPFTATSSIVFWDEVTLLTSNSSTMVNLHLGSCPPSGDLLAHIGRGLRMITHRKSGWEGSMLMDLYSWCYLL